MSTPPPPPPSNPYLDTKVLTATPEELRLMLLDGAIKFCRQGADALGKKDFAGCHEGYSRCRAILVELISSMRPEVDPALCERLTALYVFMISELVESSLSKDPARARKIVELLEYDRETWVMLMAKNAEETPRQRRRVASGPVEQHAPAEERPALSFQA